MAFFKSALDENDKMPFGKHKGERLGDVPESYLAWVSEQDWVINWPALNSYLETLDLMDSSEYENDH